MMDSLVDYVLERGNVDYGQFSPKRQLEPNSTVFNHRKLLQYLFENHETSPPTQATNHNQKRISDMKIEQMSGQLNYFSEKIHAQLVKKYLAMDGDLYRLQNQWMRKKIPDFYCYYFLKFSYANSYSRMHQLFLSELQNMNRQKDSYVVIKKTIEARELCLANLRRELASLTEADLQQSLQMLREQNSMRQKKRIQNEQHQKGHHKSRSKKQPQDEEIGKSWKNKIQLVFEGISHMRKLTCFVVQLIQNWKHSIYRISEDPRRYRERVIFYHNDANYTLKMLFDYNFITESFLKEHLTFAKQFDPFLLKPCLILQNKQKKTQDQQIFFGLLKPREAEMDKITKALVIMAEQEYDEDQQSRFINEKSNLGQLQQRKKYIQRKRDSIGMRQKAKSQAKLSGHQEQIQKQKKQVDESRNKLTQFSDNKRSGLTERELQEVMAEKKGKQRKTKLESSLNRVKNLKSVDLKKVSPYLSRNQRIQKAQQVIELEYKFKLAQSQYAQHLKEKKEQIKASRVTHQIAEQNKDVANNRVFNKYIEENLRIMDEANKKAYLYKNKIAPSRSASGPAFNYNKISYPDRKQAQYERNLARYRKPQTRQQNKKGTKAIIEISNKGIRSNQSVFEYQMHGKKGKNVGSILERNQVQRQKEVINTKFSTPKNKRTPISRDVEMSPNKSTPAKQQMNLFETEKASEIIVMRQQPQKIEELKQFLYKKIKEELIQEMKKSAIEKDEQINSLIEEEKRRRIEEIMEQKREEQGRKKEEEERMRMAQIDKQRKKIDFKVRIQPIQYAEQNANEYFDKMFSIRENTFQRIFTNEKVEQLKEKLMNEVYVIFLKGYYEGEEVAYSILHFDWRSETTRTFVLDYLAVTTEYLYISTFHQILQYLWANDPLNQLQLLMLRNEENHQGQNYVEDVQQYAIRYGEVFEKRLYSNILQLKFIWTRPQALSHIQFPHTHFYFGKKLNFKAELLSAQLSFNQRFTPKIDMNLQTFTNYFFLIEELFRCYLTPDEVVELRQNSTNIRRLKDIFRIVLELQKSNPKVDELTVVEGLNLDDLYAKLKERLNPPYERYFWNNFYDKTSSNRVLLAILESNLEIEFPLNTCYLDDRRFLRINPRRKVLVLQSSVYAKQNIYILNTNNPKVRVFFMQGEQYKLMRIELFVFLNLVFNNIVEDTEKFVNSFWIPQFVINSESGKEIKRITDFSISMKKSFFLSEQIYFCNNDYIKSGISLLPKVSDVIFRQAMIFGYLHTEVEKGSTGMPLYAKLIDRKEMF